MRHGIHSFIYRELDQLERRGVRPLLLAISSGPGPYLPRPNWTVVAAGVREALRGFASVLRETPMRLIRLCGRSVATGSWIDLAIALSFVRAVGSHGIRAVHCHFGDHKLFVGYYVSRILQIPLTATIHAYELYTNPNPKMFAEALRACEFVVTVSEYNRRILETQHRMPRDRIQIVRLFPWDVPKTVPVRTGDPFTILSVARFTPKKGHEILLKALQQILESGRRDIRLVLVGKGPVDVRLMVSHHGLDDFVTIMADISDSELRALYERASVFCLPSQTSADGDREGIPVSLMEAMACGLPVVTTAHAGIPELVREMLVPENNAQAVAHAILRLKDDPAAAQAQGRANQAAIRQGYSPRNVDELIALFRRVLSAAP
jgi:glycosyltransferase involved in cell wall biosynthesis